MQQVSNKPGAEPEATTATTAPENNNPIIVGLDVGTTKIAAIAGRMNEHGKLEILGFGRATSHGVKHGMVLNIDKTISAIQQALENCYKSNPGLSIKEVYVGIAGHHIKSLQTRGDIVREDNENEISQKDVDRLIKDQHQTYIPAGDQIIDIIPQEYTVDNISNLQSPVGYSGVKVGANFHIITGDRNAIRNIKRSVEKSSLQVKDLVLQPLASAAAVMCEQDLEAGVAIVDIGGGTTDLAVFYEGILRATAVIPFGGENITNDIKIGLGVLRSHAEQMKIKFGSALAEEKKSNQFITIPGIKGLAPKEISVHNLANIIQARMTEILDFVTFHLKQIGLNNRMLNGGVILTGGGSQLKHLIQLTEYVTGLNARIGYPNEHLANGHLEELANPMYSTCIGLILKGQDVYESSLNSLIQKQVQKVEEVNEEGPVVITTTQGQEKEKEPVIISVTPTQGRKTLKQFINGIKTGLIDLFKEEEDAKLS
ncbi:MAG: cell division protein FtsA [Bacteroidetes bacterium]|nr:cell division protein FtsA [Bacteroidota bacterium]